MSEAIFLLVGLLVGWKAGVWWANDCAACALVELVRRGHLQASAIDEMQATCEQELIRRRLKR